MSQRNAEEGMQRMCVQGRLWKLSKPLSAPQRSPLRLSALKKQDRRIAGAIALMAGCAIAFSGNRTLAQSNIVPDNTLGAETSVVVPNFQGLPVEAIGGGAARGQNLFHSFQEFNVSAGRGAYFFSPSANIQNILARVTGNNLSQILGTLGTFGNSQPNLFLMNPNGIIFGPNASLDVGGSFVATTANAIRLGNTGLFSASQPQTSNLLAINPNAFFYNQLANQGQIVNRSTATTTVLGVPTSGLQVPDGQSLLLVGGDIRLEGGRLFALGGRVELGGVAQNGTIELTTNGNEMRLGFPTDVARADVSLTNQSEINVRAGGGGSIAINARNIEVLGGSKVRAGIASGLGTPESKAGNIDVNATGTITVVGESFISNAVLADGVGKGGDINITTESLFVTEGGSINALSSGQGDAGNVTILAPNLVSFDGTDPNGISGGAASIVEVGAVGNAGNINITTGSLFVTNGALLYSSTLGKGNAGSVRITATNTVSFDGVGSNEISSGVFSSVEAGAVGDGGDIEINTNSLSVTNGARLIASTYGQGNAGSIRINARDSVRFDGVGSNGLSSIATSSVGVGAVGNGGDIEITTGSLSVSNGAFLFASTNGQGNAGSVRITATDTVNFDGVGSDGLLSRASSEVGVGGVGTGGDIEIITGSMSVANDFQLLASTFGQGDAGNIKITATDEVRFAGVGNVVNNEQASGAFSAVGVGGQGKGGDIEITSGSLSLTDAFISSVSQGTGTAGDINLQTQENLEANRSSILATTQSGDGGNINLKVGEILLLRNDSNISTTAGVAGAGGDGGNININADFVVAVPKEDSDITANAFNGRGGNINITTQGIYGLTFRERDIPASSDITASSQFGLDGDFQLDLLTSVDPSRGLAELPTNVVDASQQIDRRCTPATADQKSSFIITGRGGIPLSPNEVLQGESVITPDWVTLDSEADNISRVTHPINSTRTVKPLVEAQSWVYGANGEVILTAQAPSVTPHNAWSTSPSCDAVRREEKEVF